MNSQDTFCVNATSFDLPGQTAFYKGKVRDVYTLGDRLVMVATDRISAFDHILSRPIPFKGQILNQLAAYFLNSTRDIVPNWLEATPHPNVAIGRKCTPFKVEMVIRNYLVGHAWREYEQGKRMLCGVQLPDGLRKNQKFDRPIITPATKAENGHDMDISKEEIIAQGIVEASDYQIIEAYTYALFERGVQMARDKDLILVDTKYEFGRADDDILLIDEIHTPDSSRYFLADHYQSDFEQGRDPQQLSKEFVREWLMDHGFQGLEEQVMPFMPDSFVEMVSERYIDLYQRITGEPFHKNESSSLVKDIENSLLDYLKNVQ